MRLQSLLIHAAIAAGALLAGVLFRLVAGDAAVVLTPVLAVAAIVLAWRRHNAERDAAEPSHAETSGADS